MSSISIVIPLYNRRRWIRRCIDSLKESKFDSVEPIVVDDGSDDGGAEAAASILDELRSSRFSGRVIRQSNSGACVARNTGLKAAAHDTVLFLDSDDEASMTGISEAAQRLDREPNLDIVYGWVYRVDPDGRVVSRKGVPPCDVRNPFFDQLWHTSGCIYRRSLLERSGGWIPGLTLGDDWEFAVRARMHARRFDYLDRCFGGYTEHDEDRLTTRDFNLRKCKSVIRATLAIRHEAKRISLLDTDLDRRIHQRLLVQTLELIANGSHAHSRRLLRSCATANAGLKTRVLAMLLILFPTGTVARRAHQFIRRRSDQRQILDAPISEASDFRPTPVP